MQTLKNIRTIIIEDNPLHLEEIKYELQAFPHFQLVATASSVEEGIVQLVAHRPQLLLLDIELKGKLGFDVLTALNDYSFVVIFVTGYIKYAVQAIRFAALDYLLKPVEPEQLAIALHNAEKRITKMETEEEIKLQLAVMLDFINKTEKKEHRLAIPSNEGIRATYLRDIVHCQANGSYTHFHLNTGEELVAPKGLYQYDDLTEDYDFVKVSRDSIVNLSYVKSLKDNELKLLDGRTQLHVSRLWIDEVKDRIYDWKKSR